MAVNEAILADVIESWSVVLSLHGLAEPVMVAEISATRAEAERLASLITLVLPVGTPFRVHIDGNK